MVVLRPFLLLLTFSFILSFTQTCSNNERKTYIVYMGSLPRDLETNSIPSIHLSMAQRVLVSDFAPDAVIHSYHKSFNGFVVKLTEAEATRMRGLAGVISVFESKTHPVATTKSWDFIGFPQNVPRQSQEEGHGFKESNIVVAVIDTGIWPEHDSFNINDAKYPQSAEMKMKWESQCPKECKCNNKIIGAKSIRGGKVEPSACPDDDIICHGTHVASIIAGREIMPNGIMVKMMYPGGNDKMVRGGVPWARIAVYKVCRLHEDEDKDGRRRKYYGCKDEDILGAFEEAIKDEVHIISVSLDQKSISTVVGCSQEYFNNSYAIGAFHAMEKNILTSVAAGNHGPDPYSMRSYAPWLLSVAASTIGRNFYTTVTAEYKDGNNREFKGVSLNTYSSQLDPKPLSSNICPASKSEHVKCEVTGKIFACNVDHEHRVRKPSNVGALGHRCGVVLKSEKAVDVASIYATPATVLSESDFNQILGSQRARIDKSVVEDLPLNAEPSIASISSRGPNPITPHILKPDIAAPGVHILAAWPPCCPISGVSNDLRKGGGKYKYNVESGTSMACPHATAAAAYVKSFHPDWSPAAIKSALMTTATEMKPENSDDAAEFAYGAGQINPAKAINPGLVYNASADDYINFLCAEGYNEEKIKRLIEGECTHDTKEKGRVQNLNLPSFALSVECNFKDGEKCPVDGSFTRTVENVEAGNSIYKYEISPSPTPSSLKIEVTIHPKEKEKEKETPESLSFEKEGDKQTFTLKITGELTEKDKASESSLWMEKVSASLTWRQVDSCGQNAKFINGGYAVRSPIVVYNRNGSPERTCRTASKPIVREGISQFGYQEGRDDASTLVA